MHVQGPVWWSTLSKILGWGPEGAEEDGWLRHNTSTYLVQHQPAETAEFRVFIHLCECSNCSLISNCTRTLSWDIITSVLKKKKTLSVLKRLCPYKQGFIPKNIRRHHHFRRTSEGDNGVNLKTMLCACQSFDAEPSPSFPRCIYPVSSYHIVKHYLCTFL